MKHLSVCAVLLALASPSVFAADPPQAAATPVPTTPAAKVADRAAVQREMADLQKRMGELGRRMGALSARLNMDSPQSLAWRYMADPHRGMLGLVLSPGAKGMKVAALTPGGAAEHAGVKVGDVIERVDGKAVGGNGSTADLGPLDELKVGTTVHLGVLRNGKSRDIAVKAERREAQGWAVMMAPQMAAMAPRMAKLAAADAKWEVKLADLDAHAGQLADKERVFVRQLAPWWGLNLASLNGDLAGYFGTDTGALVLSSEPDRYPGLKAGDVITAIDGSKVDRPEDVMRALRGQGEGKTVKLSVRRHGKAMMVDMKAPPLSALLPPPPPAPPVPPPAPLAPPPPPPLPPPPPGHAV
ncbi:MAG TPA: PDZ domain-containing protein [Rhodanobacteraceae bacterium]|nr:PDZ domain-containing protein [Rhodanobacteraceae bacterium]